MGTAIISDCGKYRYKLTRIVDSVFLTTGKVLWCMLNPSTADADIDDNTIRRLNGFTTRWGYASFTVINLYAFRSPQPSDLSLAVDPVGPDNDKHIARESKNNYSSVIAAWGGRATADMDGRVDKVYSILRARNKVMCLGINSDGSPKHPLFVPYEANVIEYRGWQ